jgi:predicted ATPase
MNINSLDIEGFRSFKRAVWEPGNLNIIIGANGSGKSNLLRFLNMIKVAADGNLADAVQHAGGMGSITWNGTASNVRFILRVSPSEPFQEPDHYELDLSRLGTGSSYVVNYELLANHIRVKRGQLQSPFKFLERTPHNAVVFDENEHGLVAPEESIPEDESLLSTLSGPFVNNRRIPQFRQQLTGITLYHDLDVGRDATIRQPVVARAEQRVSYSASNLVSVLHTLYTGDREFEENIDAAMRAAFGREFLKLVFPPAGDQRIQLRVRWKTLETSAADLSDGTLRFLFLLTALASPNPASVIAIDEPETGLHPAMLPIIAEYAVEASFRAQVVLTTHSPQLLDAFTTTKPTTTVAKWHDGESTLHNLRGDDLSFWLREYSLGTLFKSGELERMT